MVIVTTERVLFAILPMVILYMAYVIWEEMCLNGFKINITSVMTELLLMEVLLYLIRLVLTVFCGEAVGSASQTPYGLKVAPTVHPRF